jgi:hypothetical protein
MSWVRAIVGVLALWSSPAWSATLTWNANTEPDLAGYRVYQCSQLPCTRGSGNASLLVTLGPVTSFDIGTPAGTRYYFLTAQDFSNNESIESLPVTFTPVGAPPSVPPAIGASPTSLSFAVTQGSGNSSNQTLSLSNTGGGTLSWSASGSSSWITVNPASGAGNGVVTVSVATGATAVGTYNGSITLSAIGGSSITVPVTLVVAPALAPPPVPSSLRISAAH